MSDYLAHHGIKGQKWGIRRYQNEDGSLTEAGRKKYGAGRTDKGSYRYNKKHRKAYDRLADNLDKIDKQAKKMHKKADAYGDDPNLPYQAKRQKEAYRHAGEVLDTAYIMDKQAMNKTLKELGMSKKEIAFCKAGRDYMNYVYGSPTTRLAVAALSGSVGTTARAVYKNSTPKGRELASKFGQASREYQNEVDKYRARKRS